MPFPVFALAPTNAKKPARIFYQTNPRDGQAVSGFRDTGNYE
jgi:hypothetical protein